LVYGSTTRNSLYMFCCLGHKDVEGGMLANRTEHNRGGTVVSRNHCVFLCCLSQHCQEMGSVSVIRVESLQENH